MQLARSLLVVVHALLQQLDRVHAERIAHLLHRRLGQHDLSSVIRQRDELRRFLLRLLFALLGRLAALVLPRLFLAASGLLVFQALSPALALRLRVVLLVFQVAVHQPGREVVLKIAVHARAFRAAVSALGEELQPDPVSGLVCAVTIAGFPIAHSVLTPFFWSACAPADAPGGAPSYPCQRDIGRKFFGR